MFGWKRKYQRLLWDQQNTLDDLAVQRGILALNLEVARQTLKNVASSDPRHNSAAVRRLAWETLAKVEPEDKMAAFMESMDSKMAADFHEMVDNFTTQMSKLEADAS